MVRSLFKFKNKLGESELILFGIMDNAEVFAEEFGCRIGDLPSTYLGLALGAGHKAVAVWDNVEERMQETCSLEEKLYFKRRGDNLDKELFR